MSAKRWFGPAELAGLKDFWAIYDAHYDELLKVTLDDAAASAEFGPLVRAMPPELIDAQNRASRERLERAIAGEWEPYETELRVQGATYARMGISFSAWYDLTGGFERKLVPLLIAAYGATPERLAATLTALRGFIDRVMVILGEEYLATKEEIIAAERRALAESEERNRLMAQVADANRFLDSIIENIPAMVFVKDAADLRFVRFNRAGEELIGHRREELIGKSDLDFFPEEQAAGFVARDRETLEKKEMQVILEEPIETRHGLRWLETRKIPILDGAGEPRFLLGISLDVTAARRARLEVEDANQRLAVVNRLLEEQNKELVRVNRAKTDFLAMMSHELRTPLNSIIGFSEVLLDEKFGLLNERQARYLRNVHDSGRHLLGLINDLLDLSKIEAGRLEVIRQPCGARSLAAEAVATLKPLAEGRQLTVTLDTDGEPLPPVSADAARGKQVLYNLLSNAIKFTPVGGQVGVRCVASPTPDFVRTEVSDTGPGISPEDAARLFTPFTQLANAKGRGGTGLGLALTRQLVELMGGLLGVEARPGGGSVFWFDLPVEKGPAQAPEGPHAAPGEAPLALVVDDDEGARELLTLSLKEGGYRTLAVASGDEAVTQARRHQPQVILLDVFLPTIDGWDVLKLLKSEPSTADIPVVMVSISSERGKAFSLGAVEHLIKPVDRDSLLSALARRSFTTKTKVAPLSVLCIDDDVRQLELFRAALEPNGFAVRTAASAREGLAAARDGRVDLVLLDLVMPDQSGIEVVANLRADEKTRALPIFLVTAHQLSPSERARLNGDVQAVLQKGSMNVTDLLSEISRVLRRS